MDKDTQVTEVVFRKFKDGDVVAIFPYIISDFKHNVMSYMHIGQHGGASLSLIYTTKLCTPDEYKDLYDELVNHYGYNLKPIKRVQYRKYTQAYQTLMLSELRRISEP